MCTIYVICYAWVTSFLLVHTAVLWSVLWLYWFMACHISVQTSIYSLFLLYMCLFLHGVGYVCISVLGPQCFVITLHKTLRMLFAFGSNSLAYSWIFVHRSFDHLYYVFIAELMLIFNIILFKVKFPSNTGTISLNSFRCLMQISEFVYYFHLPRLEISFFPRRNSSPAFMISSLTMLTTTLLRRYRCKAKAESPSFLVNTISNHAHEKCCILNC